MSRSLHRLKWKRAGDETYADITDAIVEGTVSATPHPDPNTDRPKGYSVILTLHPESTGLAGDLQSALLDVNPVRLTFQMEGADAPITDLPASVSKVPHLDDQPNAELGIPPEGHDKLRAHF
jgi:hypothetical protein